MRRKIYGKKKTNKSFDELLQTCLFEPIATHHISVKPSRDIVAKLALPVSEDGKWQRPFCAGPGARYCT